MRGFQAISPLVVFVILYLVTSIIAGDFYKMPITVAFMVSSVYAIATSRKMTLQRRIETFSHGAGQPQMMLMMWIFILAGAFASAAKEMGSIDATVVLTLNILPPNMLMPGLFIAACFISLSIGTSVGTIVALTPIAVGIAESTDTSVPMLTAVIVGGSFFGDNLSFISDTTIVATSTQGCKMSDKFKVNAYLAIPAALIILLIYIIIGGDMRLSQDAGEVDFIKIIPYLVVLLCAVVGINVMAVLALGLVLTGIIGMVSGGFDFFGWMKAMGDGIIGMGELIIITMMAGGLLEIIKRNGGITFIIRAMTQRIHGRRGAELSIAFLVSVINMCTANNTVAIITVGGIAKEIGTRFGVDNRKCASILDTMSCCSQGLIPYGAQLLMSAGLAAVNPVSIIPYLYYPFAIGFITILAILVGYPRKYS